MKASVREVKTNLSKYGSLAHSGKSIIVTKNGRAWFQLSPIPQTKRTVAELEGVSPVVSESDAISSVNPEDIEGWI